MAGASDGAGAVAIQAQRNRGGESSLQAAKQPPIATKNFRVNNKTF